MGRDERPVAGPGPVAGAMEAAQGLQRELAALGIACDVHAGHCLALVSVWSGLVVWTDGRTFRWRSGRDVIGRVVRDGLGWDACGRVEDLAGTAQRVAARYAELRRLAAFTDVAPSGWVPL
ncbi:hypothetical protein [Streptosporangium saharense]|uniref:Uncharacterized protein n=1 Tax=Streptosporangium saharense TaxID=1706840 RepID=A0A7W7QHJ8_9ACTN|nr:hypothetical protein [Streptosporangium saharense]MBB4913720.1 hypothetical protein [Streptosporangium saharense]